LVLIVDFRHVFGGKRTKKRLIGVVMDHDYLSLQVVKAGLPTHDRHTALLSAVFSSSHVVLDKNKKHVDVVLVIEVDTHVSLSF
jgi:hypothetical protein